MADELVAMLGRTNVNDQNDPFQDLIYNGFSPEEAKYIITTANNLIDNNRRYYRTYSQAIRAAITLLVTQQQQQQQQQQLGHYQRGGRRKSIRKNRIALLTKKNMILKAHNRKTNKTTKRK